MLTIDNYFKTVRDIDFSEVPRVIAAAHEFIKSVSENNWSVYYNNQDIKKATWKVFREIENYLKTQNLKGASKQDGKTKKESEAPSRRPKQKKKNAVFFYLKRFVGMHGKEKSEKSVLSLIQALQFAIEKLIIHKKSRHTKEIEFMQDFLIQTYNKMNGSMVIEIPKTNLKKLKAIINGGNNNSGSAKSKETPSKRKKKKELAKPEILKEEMTGKEILSIKFTPMGFTGKWKQLFGDPEKVFHTMIWGGEGSGKSTLAIDFANYLSGHLQQQTCYIAIEQHFSATLKSIIERLGADNPNLKFREKMKADYSDYDFVFIDSTTALGLSYDDLKTLQENNPDTCFVYVLHALKDSKNYRGERRIGHLVDIIIKIERMDNQTSVAMVDGKNRFGGKGSIAVKFN